MSRTAVYSAIVLRSRPSGENNNEISLLTAEEGIIRATVFGGAKSKLRAHSAPYNSGQVWIYRDKSKDYAKLSDFDVHFWRSGLREMYERTMAAAAVAETILSSHGGGGEWSVALKLVTETMDTLENANEELCARLLLHFLWRWTDFLGLQPNVENCAACGAAATLWFNIQESAALCSTCVSETTGQGSNLIKLNPGCRKWLSVTGEINPSLLYRYSMDSKSFIEAKSLVCAILSEALGKRLASWDW